MFSPPSAGGALDAVARGPGRGGDNLAAKYSSLAGDGTLGPKAREAAMILASAEEALNVGEDARAARSRAEEALVLFREVGDRAAVADALRLCVTALIEGEEAQAAADLATAELARCRADGDARGEAAMLLSLAEATFDNFGSERREEALESARAARQMYKDLQDTKMEGIAALGLVHGHMVKATKRDARRTVDEAIRLAGEAVALARAAQDLSTQAKALHELAAAHAHVEEFDEAIRHSKQALSAWRDLGSKKFEGAELKCLAEWQLADEQAAEALKSGQAALKIFEEVGNSKGWEASALGTVVRAHVKLEDIAAALQLTKDAVRSFQSRADEVGEIEAQRLAVEVHLAREDREEALASAEKCLDAVKGLSKRTAKERRFEAGIIHMTAQIQVAEEEYRKGLETCQLALKAYREIGDHHSAAVVLHTLSSAQVGLKEFREAIKAAGESRDFFRKRGHKRGHAYSCLTCSQAYCARGEHNRAISMTKEALKIFTEERNRKGEADALSMLAEVYLYRGSAMKCLGYAKEARDLFRDTKQPVKELEELFIMTKASFWVANEGGVPEKKGQKPSPAWEEALQIAREALSAAKNLGIKRSIVAALFGVGQVYVITRKPDEAAALIAEALPLAREAKDDKAEANFEVLTSQMHIMNGKDEQAVEPARRALDIFREKVKDSEGEDIASELIRFVEGGGSGPQKPDVADGEADSGQAGAIKTYEGPTVEDLMATITDVALSLMGVDSLDGDTPLMDAGLDSLASVEFQNNLQKEFVGVQLPSTLVFDFPSVKTMVDFVDTGLREASGFKPLGG